MAEFKYYQNTPCIVLDTRGSMSLIEIYNYTHNADFSILCQECLSGNTQYCTCEELDGMLEGFIQNIQSAKIQTWVDTEQIFNKPFEFKAIKPLVEKVKALKDTEIALKSVIGFLEQKAEDTEYLIEKKLLELNCKK